MSLRPMKPIPNLNSINQKGKILCRHTVVNKDGEQNVFIQLLGKRDVKKFRSILKNNSNQQNFMGEFLNPIVMGYFEKGELKPPKWNTIVIDQKDRILWEGTDVLNLISEEEYRSKINSNVPTYVVEMN